MMTPNDRKWIDCVVSGYLNAVLCECDESEMAIAKERLEHGIESLAQREYHRGFEDGMRIAGRES